jgi:hypothetical protein
LCGLSRSCGRVAGGFEPDGHRNVDHRAGRA